MHIFDITLNLRKRINYFNLGESAKFKIKQSIYTNILFYINIYLKTYGLQIEKLVLSENRDPVKVDYDADELNIGTRKENYDSFKKKLIIINSSENQDNSDLKKLSRTFKHQKAKEIANLSNESYRLFRKTVYDKTNCKLVSVDKLNVFKKRFLNTFFKTNKNNSGFYVEILQKIEFVLKKIVESQRLCNESIENNTFKVHLLGDGCSITKTKINLVNFCFKILNLTEQKDNTSRLYTLGIFILRLENFQEILIFFFKVSLESKKIMKKLRHH
jgi:hypothetical protein